jgi:3-hydroxyisobutyrate dehydrogenase
MTQLMVKDVKLSQLAADATGSPTPLGAMALTFYEQAAAAGDATKDFSVVFRWLAGQKRT